MILATPVNPGAADIEESPEISSSASSLTTSLVPFEIVFPPMCVTLVVIVLDSPIWAAIGTKVLIWKTATWPDNISTEIESIDSSSS